jgi:fatty-acid desaturase
MRIYNVLGYSALGLQLVLSAWLAPPLLGPWWGMAIGFGYLVMSWFLGGVYLSDVMHMGITHGALDYKEWFIKGVTLVNNTVGVYVDPVSWVNRHRLHHRFADHHGDPNKLDGDGFWRTMMVRGRISGQRTNLDVPEGDGELLVLKPQMSFRKRRVMNI